MTQPHISEFELQAYVDDQLDPVGRLEVADFLVRNPAIAARVLADLRMRDALRALAFADSNAIPDTVAQSARRLSAALARGQISRRLGRLAMAAMLILGISMTGAIYWQDWRFVAPAKAAVPEFMEEALMSHRTAVMRSRMRSQLEVPSFDPADVKNATHIAIPQMPNGWRILDVQLFPSDYGPSLQMVFDAGKKRQVSLFAVRASIDAPGKPKIANVRGNDLAYWTRGGTVYVLTGASQPFLNSAASDLSDNQDAL
jgi:anti-sigma factor RsiW